MATVSQVLATVADAWIDRESLDRPFDRQEDPVCRINAILGDIVPDVANLLVQRGASE